MMVLFGAVITVTVSSILGRVLTVHLAGVAQVNLGAATCVPNTDKDAHFRACFLQVMLAPRVNPSMIEDIERLVADTNTQLRMVDANIQNDLAIQWFRQASPYIKTHRGGTMVLCLPDTLLNEALFDNLIADLALLSHLGIRLILGFGLRSEIDTKLKQQNISSTIVEGRRVTDNAALDEIITAAGRTRTKLESVLSMGLPNTPMAGARLSVCSGNFVTAQPFGVLNGVDYQYTGMVRQIHGAEILSHLSAGKIVLLPPIGYSLTGDVFNLQAEDVAVQSAVEIKADKLIFFVESLPVDSDGNAIREASANTMERLAPQQFDENLMRTLNRAIHACRKGVSRVHLLSLSDPNALLRELFTRDGSGTLVTAERWENLRGATVEDVSGIIELISPLQENGTLATRSREALERDIENFVICEREGLIIGCAALFVDQAHSDNEIGEIACVATHPDYRGQGRAAELIDNLESRARASNLKKVMLLSTRAAHWFIERGYVEQTPENMPQYRRISYDEKRNSKIFVKPL